MAIGRTDERDTPCHPTAHCDAVDVLRARSRNPSGPRSSIPHRKAGHMIALVLAANFSAPPALEPNGPSTQRNGNATVAPYGAPVPQPILSRQRCTPPELGVRLDRTARHR